MSEMESLHEGRDSEVVFKEEEQEQETPLLPPQSQPVTWK